MADSSAQEVEQEVCSPRWVHSQALIRLRSARGEQLEPVQELHQVAATLCLILLLRSVVVVAAPHSMRVHQVDAEVAVDIVKMVARVRQAKALLAEIIQQAVAAPHSMRVHQAAAEVAVDFNITVALVLQGKALQEETIHLDPVLEVVVLDPQVSPLQAQVLQMLLAVTAGLAMAAPRPPFSWMASNTAAAVAAAVQETQGRISQEVSDIQAAQMVDVATMMQQVSALMRPTVQEAVEVAAAIIMVVAASPQADQEDQAL